jgi:ABC-type multidrug transport system ATPase subunit
VDCSSINLNTVAKKFQHKWIFRDINATLNREDIISITGSNGSGKSTFLKILSGHLSPNKGEITYFDSGKNKIDRDDVYRHLTFAAPYINLMSRLNLKENIDLYLKFKSLQNGLDTAGLIDLMKLKHAAHKELRFYSSGMQQRVKLALAICSESSILLLDEPTTNLDKEGMSWYTSTLKKYSQNRLIVIASNEERDFELCNRSLSILDYKKKKQVGLN